ncbi:hypothetical protein BaRGS_00006327 [Batillaria attramentaria]|uniref:Uncharacterized protein n=1 Tax=Batillaria attramentaria TaxID=370345 RepID=A0ABD0LTP0_9CAEN
MSTHPHTPTLPTGPLQFSLQSRPPPPACPAVVCIPKHVGGGLLLSRSPFCIRIRLRRLFLCLLATEEPSQPARRHPHLAGLDVGQRYGCRARTVLRKTVAMSAGRCLHSQKGNGVNFHNNFRRCRQLYPRLTSPSSLLFSVGR